nr:hypothetical protein GCM10020092_074410 [Actinoplanes digitatis]
MTAVHVAVAAPDRQRPAGLMPGLLAAAAGLGGAVALHRLVPAVGILTWAVALGVAAANLRVLPGRCRAGLGRLTRRMLRAGVLLLGFSVSFGSVAALGAPVVAIVAGTLLATLLFTTWLGNRMRLGGARSLLIGTGVAICGASAIAAMEDAARRRRRGRHGRHRDDHPVRHGRARRVPAAARAARPRRRAVRRLDRRGRARGRPGRRGRQPRSARPSSRSRSSSSSPGCCCWRRWSRA